MLVLLVDYHSLDISTDRPFPRLLCHSSSLPCSLRNRLITPFGDIPLRSGVLNSPTAPLTAEGGLAINFLRIIGRSHSATASTVT